MHSGIGAAILLAALLLGLQGLAIAIAAVGTFFLLGGLLGFASRALGRNDRLRITDTSLEYVNPVHPDRNRSVEFGKIAVVSIADAKVGRIKEIQVTVGMKDGTKWTFGERFMDAGLLKEFTEHLQEKIRNVES